MRFYVIREKGTDLYLHFVKRGAQTHAEPSRAHAPRLFNTKGEAKQALNWWLKGECYMDHTYSEDWTAIREEIGINWRTLPHRKAENMEIVPMLLTEEQQ